MKKLIYSPFVLIIILLAASCQKDDSAAKPKALLDPPQDSLATVSLVNNSNTSFEVSFSKSGYTVDVPENGRQSISVKAGTYDIEVYPAGSGNYTSHNIAWDNLAPVYGPRANFDHVQIAASSLQSLLIYDKN